MDNFKIKKIKRNTEKVYNLESKHKEVMNKFSKTKKDIVKLKNEILQCKNEICLLKKMKKNLSNVKKIFHLKNEIKTINDKINKFEKEEKQYYSDISMILHDYYTKKPEENEVEINNYIKKVQVNDKAKLFSNYMKKIDKKFNNAKLSKTDDDLFCKKCQCEKTLIQSKGIIVCQQCGDTENYIIDSDKPSYKEPPPEINYFAYKRINHFKECLSQFQAKESTNISKEIYDKILFELKKEKKNVKKITKTYIRRILKKLGYNRYYEHIPHIINKLNGNPAPVLPRHIEEKLNTMFIQIQEPYSEFCPENRSNFLNYSYILYKFFELLELDEYLEHFSLLKSKEKLYTHDCIWKKFCKRLKWEFIPSV